MPSRRHVNIAFHTAALDRCLLDFGYWHAGLVALTLSIASNGIASATTNGRRDAVGTRLPSRVACGRCLHTKLTLVLRELGKIRLPHSACQSQVRLLERLHESLKGRLASLLDNFIYRMHDRLDRVLFAPNRSSDGTSLARQRRSRDLIFARALNRRDVEAKSVASLKGA